MIAVFRIQIELYNRYVH